MRLTKRKALELTRDLWRWLAKNTDCEKWNWPKWEKLPDMSNHCPCCEYAEQRVGRRFIDCSKCPLQSLWGKTPFACQCSKTAPVFNEWRCGEPSEKKIAAKRIADAAAKELRKLK